MTSNCTLSICQSWCVALSGLTGRLTCNLSPVERDRNKRYPSPSAKELVDDRAIWPDPSNEGEDTQEFSNISREPIPNK